MNKRQLLIGTVASGFAAILPSIAIASPDIRNEIQKRISETLHHYIFEINDERTREEIRNVVFRILLEYKNNGHIQQFGVGMSVKPTLSTVVKKDDIWHRTLYTPTTIEHGKLNTVNIGRNSYGEL